MEGFGHVKVRFRLERDEDGYPPAGSEGLWAVPVGSGAFRIDNTPWYARDVAADDVFQAEPDAQGVLWATERVHWSGNCTIRVVPLACTQEAVLEQLVPLGVTGEGYGRGANLVALTVPPHANISQVKQRLQRGEASGEWAFEEGCISPQWASS